MSVSQEDYQFARKLQELFRDAVTACMDGNLKSFQLSFQNLLAAQRHISSAEEILEEFHSEGKTLFHIVCSSGKEEIFSYLMEVCEDPNQRKRIVNKSDHRGFTPLMYATISESLYIMRRLIECGAEVNASNSDGASAIHFAASDGSLERVKLLHSYGSSLTNQSNSGSPLHWAASNGKSSIIHYLIDNGVNLDEKNEKNCTAIFLAAVSGSDESVLLLSEAGADLGLVIHGNLTIVHICAESGMVEAVKAILLRKDGQSCCNVRTLEDNLPIHLAAMSGHRTIVEILLPFTDFKEDELPLLLTTVEGKVQYLLHDGEDRLKRWKEAASKPQTINTNTEQPLSSTDYFNKLPEPDETISDFKLAAEKLKETGNNYLKQGQYEKAIDAYSQAIQLNKYDSIFWSNRSAAHLNRQNYNQALLDAEICRRLNPGWSKGCFRLASARLALQQHEDAALAAFEGCKLDPANKELKALLQLAVKQGQSSHKALHK